VTERKKGWWSQEQQVSARSLSVTDLEGPRSNSSAVGDQLEFVGALVFLLLNFVGRGVTSLIESLGTPLFLEYALAPAPTPASSIIITLTRRLVCSLSLSLAHSRTRTRRVVKGSTTTDAAHFFLVLGAAGLPVYFGLPYALKVVHKVVALIFGFVVIGAGLITIAAVERENLTQAQVTPRRRRRLLHRQP
jgi:hypothetical protein